MDNTITSNKETITFPFADFSVGYPLTRFMSALQQNYKNTGSRKEDIRKNSRMYDDAKKERLERLNAYEAQLCENFEICLPFLKNWVAQFPVEDKIFGDVLVDCYETINPKFSFEQTVNNKLQMSGSNFLQKIRAIVLKMEETGMSETR